MLCAKNSSAWGSNFIFIRLPPPLGGANQFQTGNLKRTPGGEGGQQSNVLADCQLGTEPPPLLVPPPISLCRARSCLLLCDGCPGGAAATAAGGSGRSARSAEVVQGAVVPPPPACPTCQSGALVAGGELQWLMVPRSRGRRWTNSPDGASQTFHALCGGWYSPRETPFGHSSRSISEVSHSFSVAQRFPTDPPPRWWRSGPPGWMMRRTAGTPSRTPPAPTIYSSTSWSGWCVHATVKGGVPHLGAS